MGWFCTDDDGNQVRKERQPLLVGRLPVTVAKQQEFKVRRVLPDRASHVRLGGGCEGQRPADIPSLATAFASTGRYLEVTRGQHTQSPVTTAGTHGPLSAWPAHAVPSARLSHTWWHPARTAGHSGLCVCAMRCPQSCSEPPAQGHPVLSPLWALEPQPSGTRRCVCLSLLAGPGSLQLPQRRGHPQGPGRGQAGSDGLPDTCSAPCWGRQTKSSTRKLLTELLASGKLTSETRLFLFVSLVRCNLPSP